MRTELDRIAENNYARTEGHKQGFAEGMEKAKEAIALLRSGHSVQDVCQATGLSEADVQAFQA